MKSTHRDQTDASARTPKKRNASKIIGYGVLSLLLLLAVAVLWNYPKLDLISGFSAKSIASAHFLDGRSVDSISQSDNDIDLVRLARNAVDDAGKAATSTVFGLKERKAVFRPGLGAVLIDDDFDVDAPYEVPHRAQPDLTTPFPYGNAEPKDTVFQNVDYPKLEAAVARAFDKSGPKLKRTRAVLVVYKDHILAERYAPGFTKKSRILGWSMTKSITATYFGILQKQRKIDVFAPAPVAQWQKDDRRKITVNDLLHMNSGLAWEEDYTKISDVTKMLFQARDMTVVQAEKEAVAAPDTKWNYSSGTSNLLSGILRKQFSSQQQYLDFWYAALIDRIGMNSMLVETDMSGHFVGSSYAWATTRDWAKFGLLYLHKGKWQRDQVFDPSWVDYVTTPTTGSDGRYGAHFWLNTGGYYKDAPRDMYSANGFQGQRVFIIPSKGLVIVRLGLTEDPAFDFNGFVRDIVASVK